MPARALSWRFKSPNLCRNIVLFYDGWMSLGKRGRIFVVFDSFLTLLISGLPRRWHLRDIREVTSWCWHPKGNTITQIIRLIRLLRTFYSDVPVSLLRPTYCSNLVPTERVQVSDCAVYEILVFSTFLHIILYPPEYLVPISLVKKNTGKIIILSCDLNIQEVSITS